jgi:hypothetical protein
VYSRRGNLIPLTTEEVERKYGAGVGAHVVYTQNGPVSPDYWGGAAQEIFGTARTEKYTEAQREAFIAGWEAAGGYMGDVVPDSPAPWCAPWTHSNTEIPVPEGTRPRKAGRLWWEACQEEVEEFLAKEAEEAAARDATEGEV